MTTPLINFLCTSMLVNDIILGSQTSQITRPTESFLKERPFSRRINYTLMSSIIFWEDPYHMIERFMYRDKARKILKQCHDGPAIGHHGASTTKNTIYLTTIYREAHEMARSCDACQQHLIKR